MRRPPWSESEGAISELLLNNRLKQHHHRPLEDFIFQGWYADWTFLAVSLWNEGAFYRRRTVGASFWLFRDFSGYVPFEPYLLA